VNLFIRDDRYPFIELRRTEENPVSFKPHSHGNLLSIGAEYDGVTVMMCDGEEIHLKSGDLVFFNPNVMHSCNAEKGNSRSYWMMHLDIDWCAEIQRGVFSHDGGYLPVDVKLLSDKEIFEDFCAVCSAFPDDGLDDLVKFLSQIFEKYCSLELRPDIQPKVISEVEKYISDNPYENISLEELAEKFRQNKFHLLRSFRSTYGLPPHAYQMDIRILRAKELLKSGMSIADVAVETGFTDQSHFHRVFKKHTAATPGEYIKGQ